MTAAGDTSPAVPSAPSADASGVSPAQLIPARGSEPVPERQEQGWELSSSGSMPCAPLGAPESSCGAGAAPGSGSSSCCGSRAASGAAGPVRAGLGPAPAAPRPQQSSGRAARRAGSAPGIPAVPESRARGRGHLGHSDLPVRPVAFWERCQRGPGLSSPPAGIGSLQGPVSREQGSSTPETAAKQAVKTSDPQFLCASACAG